jgi:hypothetical protein
MIYNSDIRPCLCLCVYGSTFLNESSSKKCSVCSTDKPKDKAAPLPASKSQFQLEFDAWNATYERTSKPRTSVAVDLISAGKSLNINIRYPVRVVIAAVTMWLCVKGCISSRTQEAKFDSFH